LTFVFGKRGPTWISSPERQPLRARAQPKPLGRRLVVALVAGVVFLLSSLAASAAGPVDDYTSAIHRALSLVQFGERGDAPSVQQAIEVLQSVPGPPQHEILSDLQASPPNLSDADQRLTALYNALQQHVDTPDPARAEQALHQVLSMPRYAGIAAGPSVQQRILSAVLHAIGQVLSWLGLGNLHLHVPVWVWLGLALVAILFIIFWPARSGLTLGGRSARQAIAAPSRRPSTDFFAEADRSAASGDYAGAIRALAAGVSVRLSGELVWDRSPYTVRELFSQADHPDMLRPLLRSFEEASYGQRAIDQAAYDRAAESAARFRMKAA
jgi:hypothetical protein